MIRWEFRRAVEKVIPLIGTRVFNSATAAYTTGSALTFNSERRDDGSLHNLLANTSRLVAAGDGWYAITGHAAFASGAGTFRTLSIRLNGATTIAVHDSTVFAGGTTVVSIATQYYMISGNYVELLVTHDKGSALNINAAANYSPEFSLVKLR